MTPLARLLAAGGAALALAGLGAGAVIAFAPRDVIEPTLDESAIVIEAPDPTATSAAEVPSTEEPEQAEFPSAPLGEAEPEEVDPAPVTDLDDDDDDDDDDDRDDDDKRDDDDDDDERDDDD